MKKVNFIVAIIINVLFTSCTLEQSLNGSMALIDNIECEDCPPIVLESEAEYESLQKIWTNDEVVYFHNPMHFGEDIIFFDRGLVSINKYTGKKNWSVNPGYISNFAEPILEGDNLYLVDDNTIYVFDLVRGENTLVKHWKSSEDISRDFHIFEEMMYVHVKDKNNGYSAFASCALDELSTANWVYFNEKTSANGGPILTQYRDAKLSKNGDGDIIIYYIASSRNFTTYTGDTGYKIEAFNVTKQNMNWINDQGLNTLSPDQLLLKDDQLIVRGIDFVLNIHCDTGDVNWKTFTDVHEFSLSNSHNMFLNENHLYLINGEELIRSLNLYTGELAWTLNEDKVFVQHETGLFKGSKNVHENKLYYLSSWGYLMEVDLDEGTFIKHHNALEFNGGLVLTGEGNFIAKTKYIGSLLSFSL